MKQWLIIVCLISLNVHLTKSDIASEGKHWYTIDLFQHIVWNRTCAEQTAIPIPSANTKNTAFFLQDTQRCLEVSHDFVQSTVSPVIQNSNELTIIAAVKQKPQNSGSIVAFSSASERYFELESSGRRDEIRIHYIHNYRTHTEVFPYQLADNQWHKIALSITDSFIQVFIDCNKAFERQIKDIDFNFLQRNDVQLWIGQRNDRHAFFQGSIEYIQFVTSSQGYTEQCPYADIACPTCSQFKSIDRTVSELYSLVKQLHIQLKSQEDRLEQVEKCECRQSCEAKGVQYRDGETWKKDHCTTCTCRGGEVQCEKPECPALTCQHPVLLEGQCCPMCYRQCYHNGNYYEHGESFTSSGRVCVSCECQDGKLSCTQKRQQCPVLTCPEHQQRLVDGQCCKQCSDYHSVNGPADYCSSGHHCHANATCINLSNRYTCRCKDGFLGNENYCADVNECDQEGGPRGNHCSSHSTCINTLGSYNCKCHSGYIQVDPFICREHNECDTGVHTCANTAQCRNLQGGYECICLPGYSGDGYTCQPMCESGCQNGGVCVAPGTCQCRKGFYGQNCQFDLNECSLGIAKCDPNSECINIPGDYICECRPGYLSNSPDNKNGLLCQDINECLGYGGGHRCSDGTLCQNTDGGYQCVCTDPDQCRNNCYIDAEPVVHGAVWPSTEDVCSVCKCNNGRVDCEPPPCDCSSPRVDLRCCPGCRKENRCPHQELKDITFDSGDTWTYQCQTCQCINGETDCWRLECPKLQCSPTVQLPGDCCPRCANEIDPCNDVSILQGARKENPIVNNICDFDGKKYRNGDKWKMAVDDNCNLCTCTNGHVCCSHNQTCGRHKNNPGVIDGRRTLLNGGDSNENDNNRNSEDNLKNHNSEFYSFDKDLSEDLDEIANNMKHYDRRNINHRGQQDNQQNAARYSIIHDTGQIKGTGDPSHLQNQYIFSNNNNNNNINNRQNDKTEKLETIYNNRKVFTGRSLSSSRDKSVLYNRRHRERRVRGGRGGLRSDEDVGPDWSYRDKP